MKYHFQGANLDRLIQNLLELRGHCLATETSLQEEIDRVAPAYRPSARNLVHYLALRQHDLRDQQRELSRFGLSSLGRMEGHTLAAIDAVIVALQKLRGGRYSALRGEPPVDFEEAAGFLRDMRKRSWAGRDTIPRASWSPCPARPLTVTCWCETWLPPEWM